MSKLNSSQELSNKLHVLLALLVVSHMARVRERVPLDLRDEVEGWADDGVLRLVKAAVQKQRRDGDLGDLRDACPRLERSTNVELVRTVPVFMCEWCARQKGW